MATKILLTKLFSLTFLKVSIFFFVCTTLFVPKINAQVPYTPFPKGNISWQSCGSKNGYIYPIIPCVISIDTAIVAIENKVYNKIYCDKYPNKERYIGGVREENKKIYVYAPDLGEHLIYDFGLEVGDTLFQTISVYILPTEDGALLAGFLSPENFSESVYYVVQDRGTKTLKTGEIRNMLVLDRYIQLDDQGYQPWSPVEWVEGLGTIGGRGFLETLQVLNAGYFYSFLGLGCIHLDNVMLYSGHPYYYECSHCDENKINENLQHQILIYPNPTTGELIIENGELRIENVEISDVYGRKVSYHHLITSSSNQKIDISHLQVGIYFVKLITEKGTFVEKIVKK